MEKQLEVKNISEHKKIGATKGNIKNKRIVKAKPPRKAEKSNKKYFVVDTNVFIHDPKEALLAFGSDNVVVICGTVMNELDDLKKNEDESIAHSAREVARHLDGFIMKGDVCKGVKLPNGGTLLFKFKHNYPLQFKEDRADNRILSFACGLAQEPGKRVVTVSKDIYFRAKAAGLGLEFKDYEKDQSDLFRQYGAISNGEGIPNGVLSVRYKVEGENILRFRGKEEFVPIRRQRSILGISPRNEEQECVLDALSCPDIETVALSGIAGAGKTFLALLIGLHQTLKSDPLYDRVIVARPPVPVGRDIGYLPGDKEEKLLNWMSPITDNLGVIFKGNESSNDGNGFKKKFVEKGLSLTRESLTASGILQIEAISHIRGRSLPRNYIIIDEAQNLRPLDVKTLITRCGEGSKIVFCGDLDQIDTPYLNSRSSGLAHLIDRFKDETDFCYIRLEQSVRSKLAEKAARLL